MSTNTLSQPPTSTPFGAPTPPPLPTSARKRGPTLALGAGLLVALAAGLIAGLPARSPAAQALSSSSTEVTKVALADTSIDTPGLWTSYSGTVRSVLAWTGTDPAHRLNVMTSGIGTQYTNKITLSDTSIGRPAVTRTPSSGKVAVAWTGTDLSRTLNVLFDVYGVRSKLILWGENSSHSPALIAATDSTLLLAWTGTDAGHSLNLQTITVSSDTVTKGRKLTLWSDSSASAPNLSYEPSRSEYLLSWSASANNRVVFSRSTDALTWSAATTIAEWTYAAPSLLPIVDDYYGMPTHYLSWTGTDAARSLNFQYTTGFPAWTDPATTKATLSESVWGAPALGFISGPGLVLAAWTSTDAAHHMNVALLTPMAPPPCALPGITPITPTVISQGTSGRKEVALTFDEDEDTGNPASLLDTLQSKGVPATWFLSAKWAQSHPDLVLRAKNQGIVIGNHTVDHPNLTSPARSDTFVCAELGLANQIIADRAGITGTRPYFRPPYGNYNAQIENLAAKLGYKTFLWSIDPRDWDSATSADMIYNTVKTNLGPGKIILMHGASIHEPEALPRVIDYIRSQGYSIVSLDRLLAP